MSPWEASEPFLTPGQNPGYAFMSFSDWRLRCKFANIFSALKASTMNTNHGKRFFRFRPSGSARASSQSLVMRIVTKRSPTLTDLIVPRSLNFQMPQRRYNKHDILTGSRNPHNGIACTREKGAHHLRSWLGDGFATNGLGPMSWRKNVIHGASRCQFIRKRRADSFTSISITYRSWAATRAWIL